jgi:hypothetical protein
VQVGARRMTYDMIRQSRDVVERGSVFTPDDLPPDVRQINFGTPDLPKGEMASDHVSSRRKTEACQGEEDVGLTILSG